MLVSSQMFFLQLAQGLRNCGPAAKSSLPSIFLKKLLLEHSHAHHSHTIYVCHFCATTQLSVKTMLFRKPKISTTWSFTDKACQLLLQCIQSPHGGQKKDQTFRGFPSLIFQTKQNPQASRFQSWHLLSIQLFFNFSTDSEPSFQTLRTPDVTLDSIGERDKKQRGSCGGSDLFSSWSCIAQHVLQLPETWTIVRRGEKDITLHLQTQIEFRNLEG